jgi:hypothetical protein
MRIKLVYIANFAIFTIIEKLARIHYVFSLWRNCDYSNFLNTPILGLEMLTIKAVILSIPDDVKARY